ncbi:hypothetical protein NC651_029710 [Populus alba x Populus x berolinensis]|nr:hypothetical protein NC651_029710 [Populus alba x Populus x berolinensis]
MASLLVSINFSTPLSAPKFSFRKSGFCHKGTNFMVENSARARIKRLRNYNKGNQLLLDYQAKQQPGQQLTDRSLAAQLERYFL